jgi:hypothetical protein
MSFIETRRGVLGCRTMAARSPEDFIQKGLRLILSRRPEVIAGFLRIMRRCLGVRA